mgnify:FL=1
MRANVKLGTPVDLANVKPGNIIYFPGHSTYYLVNFGNELHMIGSNGYLYPSDKKNFCGECFLVGNITFENFYK